MVYSSTGKWNGMEMEWKMERKMEIIPVYHSAWYTAFHHVQFLCIDPDGTLNMVSQLLVTLPNLVER